jgi:hypothetical protein
VTAPDEAALRCRRGPRCGNTTRHTLIGGGGLHLPDWATTPGGLCRTDTTKTLRAVEQLPRDYLELGLLLAKTGSRVDAPTGGTRERPVPLRLGVLTLQEEITAEVELWAEAVADQHGLPWHSQNARTARATHAGRALAAGCTLLSTRHDALLALPPVGHLAWAPSEPRVQRATCPGGHWHTDGGVCTDVHVREVWGDDRREWQERDGVDGALALLALHERVEQVEGRTHRAHRLWSPCPEPTCQALALERPEGAGHVYCRRCGHREPLERYEERADVLAKAYEGSAA